MADGRHFEKTVKSLYLRNWFWWNFVCWRRLSHYRGQTVKIAISSQRLYRFLLNLVRWCKMGLLTAPTVKMEFQNPRWQTATILKTVKSPYFCNRSTDFDESLQFIVSVYVVLQHALMHMWWLCCLLLLFHINTCSNFVALAHRFTYRFSCNTSGNSTCYAH